MSLLKEIVNEVMSKYLKTGIYDKNGTFIKGIVGSGTIRKGNLDDYNKQYLLPNQIIGLFKNLGWIINIDLFNAVRNSDEVVFKPTGYFIDKNHKKYDLYSYNKFADIMIYGFLNGKWVKDKDGKFVLTSYGQKMYNTYVINKSPKDIENKKDVENKKWADNVKMRGWYDVSEKDL